MFARAAARHLQGSTRSLGFRAAASCSTATALRPALELCGASDAYAFGKLKFPGVIQLPLQLNHGFAAKTEVLALTYNDNCIYCCKLCQRHAFY
jgi:hypothetical protein